MKKNYPNPYLRIIFLLIALILSTNGKALVSSYAFTQASGVYSPISGGTVLGDTTNDDNNFPAQPIGFTFYFNGQSYTQFGVNANGYIVLGNLANSSQAVLSNGNNNNVVSALNYDLRAQSTSTLQFRTTGTAPNQTLVVQWTSYREYNSVTGDNLNFQIRLNEGTNSIDVIYGTCISTTTQLSETGLRGNSNADYNNRYVSDTVNTWATSTPGLSNSDRCVIKTGFNPVSGQRYSWQPPTPPAAPINMVFTNITPTSMTVNWTDNSTNETSFRVYQSSDSINFTFVGTIPSTTAATTGTSYSYTAAGLYTGITYYFRVYAFENTPSPTYLSGNEVTLTGILCGNYNIGPTGAYPNINSAIADLVARGLSCSVILELQPGYLSAADTFPVSIPFLGCLSTKTLTLRPESGATNLKIAGDSARIIDLNGATWFILDGRAGGTGSTRDLSVVDSLATGNAIRFINDAQNNTITYTRILGATRGSTTNGVIQFAAGSSSGNSDNTISFCELSKSDSFPQVLLYSNAPNGVNANNTITDNIFHDWFANNGANYGINLGAGNAAWIIHNNSFYQTAPQTYNGTNGTHAAINISGTGFNGSSGSGFILSDNFIGGSAPNCGGTAWVMNGVSTSRFNGINVNVGTTSYTEIQGNTIRNITLTTAAGAGGGPGASASIFTGINISGGYVNAGTSAANVIGSLSSNNSIQTIASGNGPQTIGINSASSGIVNILGNAIGGMNANDSASTINTNLFGILVSAGTTSVRNNVIGSPTLANSMVNAASTGTGSCQVTGISCGNTSVSIVSGNSIRNLSCLYQGTTSGSFVRGISTSGGSNTISANLIESISNASPQAGTNGNASVIGISQTSNQPGQEISGNIIRSLSNKSTSGNTVICGIYHNGSNTGNNNIMKNRIYGLSATLDTAVVSINGIHINGGHSVISNNMIALGTDTNGTSYTASNEYNGILKTTTGSNSFYFNSVRIGGTSVTSRATNTFAFRRTSSGTDTLRNNIFSNFRSNAAGGGNHYSVGINSNAGLTSGANDFFGNGNGYFTGLVDTINHNSLFSWFSATGIDSNSVAFNPNFVSANNLHINNATPSALESKGYTIASVATDFDSDVRPGPAGSTNGGATAPDIGADEFDGLPITLDMGVFALVRPGSGCHTASDSVTVSIKNYSSQTVDFSVNPVAVHVSVTGTNPTTFPVVNVTTGTLASGSTRNVVISTTYNMSALGTYVFNAYTATTGDIITYNDTLAPVTISLTNGVTGPSFSSICSGLPVTLTVSGQTAGSTIQWQSSPNQSVWTNIGGATAASVTVTPGANTYYRAVTCGLFNSNTDTVNVTSVASPAVNSASRCGIGPVTLTATSVNPVAWFDSLTGGTLLDTGLVFTALVNSSRSFYAAANGNISAPKNMPTIISGPNNSGGIMFTITALTNVTVTGFDAQADSGVNTWNIYYRPDVFTTVPGANTNSSGWIFVDSASSVTSAGAGSVTAIPISMSVLIPAGNTYSFYVNVTSGPNVIYSVGTGTGNVNTSNADLQLKDGFAGQFFNCTTSPRVFNGTVHYRTSCLSSRVAANVTVTPPPAINALASSASLCGGDSVNLQVNSANANYTYAWSPTTGLTDSTGAAVWASPTAPFTYYVTAHDSITGCGALDSVSVNVYASPAINITANNDSICTGDSLFLNVAVPQFYAIGNGNNSNNPTTYPAPYGNSSWGARHQILVRADEMTAAGMVPGYINSLSFNVSNTNGSGSLTNFTIRIGTTGQSVLTDTFQVSALTTVYTNAAYTPTTGINTHVFTVPFQWNGTSNILLETCFNDTSATVNASTRRTNANFPSCTYYNSDSSANCTESVGTVSNLRPNIRLGIRNQYNVQWISNQALSSTTVTNPSAVPTQTDVYYVTVTDTITGCSNSDSITVVVDPPPVVSLGIDTNACGSILLDAGNPGDTYLWSDSSASQTLLATTTGTYSVLVTHLASCSSSDTVNVTILPLSPVFLTLPFDSLCINSGLAALSGGSPANGTFDGAGVTGNNFFDPLVAGAGVHVIGYTFTDTATGCPNTAYDSLFVDICAGIANAAAGNSLRVFPNPVRDQLNVDFLKISEKCRLEILTPESKIIYAAEVPGGVIKTIQTAPFAAGVYYVKIAGVNINYIYRFVKQ